MKHQNQGTVVGVFESREQAQQAIRELKHAGFSEEDIGVASSGDSKMQDVHDTDDDTTASYAGAGAATGAAAGAGVGALWGLGVLAGALPAIGPAIAGGTLAALLSSAAAGAAAAGLAGALVGMGMSPEEAEFYEGEVKSGRTIVSVRCGTRRDEAFAILQRFGGYDMSTRNRSTAAAAQTGAACAVGESHATHQAAATRTPAQASAHATGGSQTGTVQAVEEQVKVSKTPVQKGNVTVRKEAHTEHKTIDVPVTREEIVVEHHAGSGQCATGSTGQQEIRIPVTEEQVHVEKQPVVVDEVKVGKRKVQDTQRVDATVRKEEVKVEATGNVDVRENRPRK